MESAQIGCGSFYFSHIDFKVSLIFVAITRSFLPGTVLLAQRTLNFHNATLFPYLSDLHWISILDMQS